MNAENHKKKKPYVDDYNKDRVLHSLAATYPEGKSTAEMEESIGIHHDTVLRKCNELMEDRLLEKIGGKRGKYYLTAYALGHPNLIASRFGHSAIVELFKNQDRFLCLDSEFTNKQLIKTVLDSIAIRAATKDNRVVGAEPAWTNGIRKLQMFEIVNRIGALVTYFLIDALNPEKIRVITNRKLKEKSKIKYIQQEGAMQTDLIDKRLKNELQPLLLLWELKNYLVKDNLSTDNLSTDTKVKVKSQYHISEKDFALLVKTYSEIYPHISRKLESVKKEMESDNEKLYSENEIHL